MTRLLVLLAVGNIHENFIAVVAAIRVNSSVQILEETKGNHERKSIKLSGNP